MAKTPTSSRTLELVPNDAKGKSDIPTPVDLRVQLRDDIIQCVLEPGQRLKFEDLRTRYDAGVGSLREALLQLASEGLVIAESNRGFCVAPVSIADLDDLTNLRIELESKALTLSIEHGDDAWEGQIVAALHMLVKLQSAKDPAPTANRALWEERHRAFHEALVAACPSVWTMRFRKVLFDQSQRYRSVSIIRSPSPGRLHKHKELADLVLARDVAGAVAAMTDHIRHTSDNVRQWLSDHGQDLISDL
jgi:GntR family transcriptional regulator, carbon starvation induced regulator